MLNNLNPVLTVVMTVVIVIVVLLPQVLLFQNEVTNKGRKCLYLWKKESIQGQVLLLNQINVNDQEESMLQIEEEIDKLITERMS